MLFVFFVVCFFSLIIIGENDAAVFRREGDGRRLPDNDLFVLLDHKLVVFAAIASCDASHIISRLAVWRDLKIISNDRILARVVTRERQFHIAFKSVEQEAEIAGAALHIFSRIVDAVDAESRSRRWNELHEPSRPFI